MKRKYYDEGGDVLEAINASAEAQDIAKSMGAGPKMEEMPKASSKSRTVSKKELEESGMSLRDYLNRERGLKRRKEKDPTAGDSPDKAAQEAADAMDATRDMRAARYTPPGSAPKQTTQKPKPKVLMPSRPDNSFPGSKFKSGGSVSSASRRADGIATKGKTKGTMIAMRNGGKC
jgi:hypothetical protein